MNDYQKKMIANQMEPIFKKMKVGDRGIFDIETGQEYFIAKNMSKLSVGAYKDRKYILPIEYLNDIKTGLNKEAGYQITAGYFGSHFTYVPERKKEGTELEEQLRIYEIRRADMENYQKYSIWKHANEDVWKKCDENFGKGGDVLVLVDVKEVCEFDYKGEHFKVSASSLDKNQFSRNEYFEPIGEVAKVAYYRFTEKDFVNVVMKEALIKEGNKMNKKDFLKMCLEEKNKLQMEGIKAWEVAIQEAVEKVFPDELWYKVTDVSIFNELLSGKMPVDVCEMVWSDVEKKVAIEELKKRVGYEFECNMDNNYRDYKEYDEWGCAFAWLNDFGVEYNFCMQGEQENCCAIYRVDLDEKTGHMVTDSSSFEHYEIDFNKDNWEKELENAMCEALIHFFELDKQVEKETSLEDKITKAAERKTDRSVKGNDKSVQMEKDSF